jgi:hypothetical protein
VVRHGARFATTVVVGVVVGVSLLATLAFAVATVRSRPLENTEGCLLFEASRIRAGLPLYTDPLRGARDYGAVPARYYVLYPPLWSALLALLPEASAPTLARGLSGVAWYGALAWIAWGAHRRKRPLGVIFAAFVGGVYTLTLYAASARPDAAAVALAAVALERSARAKRTGPLEGAMFAVAAWLKPNVIGLGVGAMASQVAALPRVLLGWTAVTAAVAATLQSVSGGLWLHHLASTTLQPLSLSLWVEQITTRGPFFAVPVAFALVCGQSGRADPGVRIAVIALATSLAWTLVSLAKIGSTTCYWMEPCIGALVVCAHAPVPTLSPRWKVVLSVAAPLSALWTGVASVRSSVESILTSPEKARALRELRDAVAPAEEEMVILSDDVGIELALNGRLVDTPFQTTGLVRAGRFPRDLWIADVERSAIVGLVATSDLLERPLDEVDPVHDRYDVTMRRVLTDELVLAKRVAGFYVYVRR